MLSKLKNKSMTGRMPNLGLEKKFRPDLGLANSISA